MTATEFLKQSTTTAEYFGFQPIEHFKKNAELRSLPKLEHTATAQNRRVDALHGLLTNGVNAFCDARLHNSDAPALFYTVEQVPRSGEAALSLHVFNVEKSIGEALLIQTTRALTSDLGFTNHHVRINSLGDRDSSTRYTRELTNYLKKRLNDLPETARELMKVHAIETLLYLLEKNHELAHRTPSPLEYLTDPSRKHFREIIEFLDMTETPYEIDPKLIGHHTCYSDALFAVDLLDDDGAPLASSPLTIRGGRYNEFVYRTTKRTTPAAGALVILHDKKAPLRTPKPVMPAPEVYVVQLGFGPKIRSLLLIDELRKAGIVVHQNLASDSLSTQLRDAESRAVKYTIIIGQKEFVDNTVILRDMIGRNQENVPMAHVVTRLQRSRVSTAAS